MNRIVRAAAAAAATLAFAGAALIGGPASAYSGAGPSPTMFSDAAQAGLAPVNALGLNGPLVAAPAAPSASAAVDGQSLDTLVATYAAEVAGSADAECLANAVYFEARGESLRGQLAVAQVVLNRASSGRFPASICGVVVQPAQFSFVRRGHMPRADRSSEAWRRAVAIARIAVQSTAPRVVPTTCLWYHANYVSPSWGHRLEQSARIGLHIFYS